MSDPDHVPPPRGDEAELFRRFNGRLMAHITDVVRFTTRHTVEDACAHAWAQFLRLQPDRDSCEGWLVRTAEREAWALERAVIREWLKAQILGMRHPANDLAQLDEY